MMTGKVLLMNGKLQFATLPLVGIVTGFVLTMAAWKQANTITYSFENNSGRPIKGFLFRFRGHYGKEYVIPRIEDEAFCQITLFKGASQNVWIGFEDTFGRKVNFVYDLPEFPCGKLVTVSVNVDSAWSEVKVDSARPPSADSTSKCNRIAAEWQ